MNHSEPAADLRVDPAGLDDRVEHGYADNGGVRIHYIVTLPGAGHFVQHDAAQRVTDTVVTWLRAHHPALVHPESP